MNKSSTRYIGAIRSAVRQAESWWSGRIVEFRKIVDTCWIGDEIKRKGISGKGARKSASSSIQSNWFLSCRSTADLSNRRRRTKVFRIETGCQKRFHEWKMKIGIHANVCNYSIFVHCEYTRERENYWTEAIKEGAIAFSF